MSSLADFIEQYLRGILLQQKTIELQRRELAKKFRCAPSQINYVLETRFNLDRGFIVESKRGGGGYIRITLVNWRTDGFPQLINELIPEKIDPENAEQLLTRLVEAKLISPEAAQLSYRLMMDDFVDLPAGYTEFLRAKFLKALLLVLGTQKWE